MAGSTSHSRCRHIRELSSAQHCPGVVFQEVDPEADTSQLAGLGDAAGGLLTELAGALPGIDEAMSFAEVLKQVHL
jgi:anion-transporting  ArsA/GET3 family ATPase